MLVVLCPHCGPRTHDEFTHKGEIVARPGPDASPREWRAYLYERENRAGVQTERWFHLHGCRRFLEVERSTVTNEITSTKAVEPRS